MVHVHVYNNGNYSMVDEVPMLRMYFT